MKISKLEILSSTPEDPSDELVSFLENKINSVVLESSTDIVFFTKCDKYNYKSFIWIDNQVRNSISIKEVICESELIKILKLSLDLNYTNYFFFTYEELLKYVEEKEIEKELILYQIGEFR